MKIPKLVPAVLAFTMLAGPVQGNECTDAEVLALEISGEIVAPLALVTRIDADLAAIRADNPYLSKIHARPDWVPGELLLKLTEDAYASYLAGEYHDLDALNSTYGLTDMRQLFNSWFVLEFDEAYHPIVLGNLYEDVGSVLRADPNGIVGDGDDIGATEVGRYAFRHAWGDCPAGCIHEHVWVYTVDGGTAQLVVEYGDEFTAPTNDSSLGALKARFHGQD